MYNEFEGSNKNENEQPTPETQDGSTQYRMKFENGQKAEQTNEQTSGQANAQTAGQTNTQAGGHMNNSASTSGANNGYQSYGYYQNTYRQSGTSYNNQGAYGGQGNQNYNGNNYGAYNQGTNYGNNAGPYYNNEYSYYQQQSVPGNMGGRKKQKTKMAHKKNGVGKQLAKVVCFGLIFGLVAGGTMVGVNALGNLGDKPQQVAENTAAEPGFTLDVVKTSSKDVETFEASGVSDIVKEVKPSIVSVNTLVETTSRDFFGRTYSQEGTGAGSGIIFSEKDGTMYLITNYHVIEDSKEITVTFNDGSTAQAQVKGYDKDGDIAVLTVDMSQLSEETKNAIKIAVLGDSDALLEGEGAIAIGNALGYGQSTTTGAISAVNREVPLTDGTMTLIQTDAAINPGNSGGALLNSRGEVIGVNTVKFSDTSVEGMGYAIPINTVVETVNDIISGKFVTKTADNTAVLGIRGGTVDEMSSEVYGWPVGVMVAAVEQNSAAQRAGIQPGYVIVGFNGSEIATMEQLQELIKDCMPGDSVTIDVMIPDADGEYSSQPQTLQTLMGSAAEAGY